MGTPFAVHNMMISTFCTRSSRKYGNKRRKWQPGCVWRRHATLNAQVSEQSNGQSKCQSAAVNKSVSICERTRPNAGWMEGQRLGRWPSIQPALGLAIGFMVGVSVRLWLWWSMAAICRNPHPVRRVTLALHACLQTTVTDYPLSHAISTHNTLLRRVQQQQENCHI